MRVLRLAAAIVLVSAIAACDDRSGVPGGPDAGGPFYSPVAEPRFVPAKVDILVVMDNRAGMGEEQALFADWFPAVLQNLFSPPEGSARAPLESLNLGVVSTDLGTLGNRVSTCNNGTWGYAGGDGGCLRNTGNVLLGGCASSYPTFLSRGPENAATYPVDQLAADFTCIATLGTNGCGWPQQLEAAREALGERQALGECNDGFRRRDALLLVLWLSVEDDMSVDPAHPEMFDPDRTDLGHLGDARILLHPEMLQPVDLYVELFRALDMADDSRVLLAMLVGVPPGQPNCTGRGDSLGACLDEPAMQQYFDPVHPTAFAPSCDTELGLAFAPRRFVALAQAWGHEAYVGSICTPDGTTGAAGIIDLLDEGLEEWTCFPELGFEEAACTVPDCFVVETRGDDGPCLEDPACPSSACPPATLDGLADGPLVPCVDPSTGAECVPSHRDLGLVAVGGDDRFFRQCLVRESERAFDAATGRCGEPLADGWYYLPAAWSEHDCPEILFSPGPLEVLPYGSTAQLLCRRARL
jgi:hypothetical protein